MVSIMSLIKWKFSNMATLAFFKFLKITHVFMYKIFHLEEEFEELNIYSKSTKGKIKTRDKK